MADFSNPATPLGAPAVTALLAVGANYHYSPQWTFRGGLAFDKSPVQQTDMTACLPDADRTMLTLGG